MSHLYLFLFFMLVMALSLVTIPLVKNGMLLSRYYFGICFSIVSLSCLLYLTTTNTNDLQYWLTEGKTRYQLLEQFEALGGIDGAIKRIQEKLKIDSTNAEGWLLLGKLYLSKQDTVNAKAAFEKAQALQQ